VPSNAIAGDVELCPVLPATTASTATSAVTVGSRTAGNWLSARMSSGTVIAMRPSFHADVIGHWRLVASIHTAWLYAIQLIEGEATNIKITRPLDLLLAEKILEERTA
jgi:hypothetical protein